MIQLCFVSPNRFPLSEGGLIYMQMDAIEVCSRCSVLHTSDVPKAWHSISLFASVAFTHPALTQVQVYELSTKDLVPHSSRLLRALYVSGGLLSVLGACPFVEKEEDDEEEDKTR